MNEITEIESMEYEKQKTSGELPIIGVNTFLNKKGEQEFSKTKLIRSTKTEQDAQVKQVNDIKTRFEKEETKALQKLKQ